MKVERFKPLFFIIPLSFVLGIAWSLYLKEKRQQERIYQQENFIKVLAPKNYLPKQSLESFKKKYRLGIQVTVIDSERLLLLEALNSNNSYDVIFIDSANARFIINTENLLKPTAEDIPNLTKISADFRDLSVAGQPYLVPHSWQLIGWLVEKNKSSDLPEPFSEVFKTRAWRNRVALLPSYIELYNVMKKFDLFAEEWFDTEQLEKIVNSTKFISSQKVEFFAPDNREQIPKDKWLLQIGHTQAVNLEDHLKNYEFYLPREKGSLRVFSMVIDKRSPKLQGAKDFVNHLLTEDSVHEFIEQRQLATTVNVSALSGIPAQFYPQYLRRLPVSRVELSLPVYANHATWVETLRTLNIMDATDMDTNNKAEN